jgi:hypothetical protein
LVNNTNKRKNAFREKNEFNTNFTPWDVEEHIHVAVHEVATLEDTKTESKMETMRNMMREK